MSSPRDSLPIRMATAVGHHRAGRLQEATQLYELVLEEDSQYPAARHNLGMALLGLGDLGKAMALLEHSFAEEGNDPAWTQSLSPIGMTLFQQGRWEHAKPWLERAAVHNPDDQAVLAALDRIAPRRYLAPEIFDVESQRNLQRYAPREAPTYVYSIDVVGTCNLRCPTCPVGNSPTAERASGFMALDLFQKILTKIIAENGSLRPEIWLFNWGEPLLHPQIGEIIQQVREAELPCHLSTNLNTERGLREVAKADPTNLKISLSGFSQDTYAMTHRRGNLNLVKANLYLLRHYLDKYRTTTRVWIGHHLYRNNHHQIEMVAALCQELGFEHHPVAAFYQPLERLVELLEGRGKGDPILDQLLEHPNSYLPRIKASRSGRYDCELRFNQTVINFDGSVALCCSVYDQPNMLGAHFLEHEHAELQAMKYRHPFCQTCIRHGLAYMPADILPPPTPVFGSGEAPEAH